MNESYQSFKQLCDQRQSIRQFVDKPVSSEDIDKIKQIAATAPYASGRKNWEIIVVDNKDIIQQLVTLVKQRSTELKEQLKPDFQDGFEQYTQHFIAFAAAPVLFLPVFKVTPVLSYMLAQVDERILQWERDSYVKSIAGVGLLILLAAESLGLGGCYMTGALVAEEDIKKLLNIKGEKNIGAVIPVGYPLVS